MALTKHEEIMEKLGGIEHHLKTLNGKVARNILEIEKLREQQDKDNIDKAKIQGGWKVLAILGSLAMAIGGLVIRFIK